MNKNRIIILLILVLSVFLYAETDNDPAVKYKNASELADADQYETAIKELNSLIEILSSGNTQNELLAQCYLKLGESQNAIGESIKAIENYDKANGIIKNLNSIELSIELDINYGSAYLRLGNHQKAQDFLQAGYEKAVKNNYRSQQAFALKQLASVLIRSGKLDSALELLQQALQIYTELKILNEIADIQLFLGAIHTKKGDLDIALNYFQKALPIAEKIGHPDQIAVTLSQIGWLYKEAGELKKALEYMNKAIVLVEKINNLKGLIICLLDTVDIYTYWGVYSKAEINLKRAYEAAVKLQLKVDEATALDRLGKLYIETGDYQKALQNFKQALAINTELKNQDSIMYETEYIGIAYKKILDFKQAEKFLKNAYQLAESNNSIPLLSAINNHLGEIAFSQKKYDDALAYFKKALNQAENANLNLNIPLMDKNLGNLYIKMKKYKEAGQYLTSAVQNATSLWENAEENVKRDFLNKLLLIYNDLTYFYLKEGKQYDAFDNIEQSYSKYFYKNLEAKASQSVKYDSIRNIQASINDTTCVVNYIIRQNSIITFVADKKQIKSFEIPITSLYAKLKNRYNDLMKTLVKPLPVFISDDSTSYDLSGIIEKQLAEIIMLYRIFMEPPLVKEKKQELDFVSRELYRLLFEPLETNLKNYTDLIIIPHGPLALLPFETLLDNGGKYLVEKYNIRYIQSLQVFNALTKRNYSKTRKELLAFGGAIYDSVAYDKSVFESAKQIGQMRDEFTINPAASAFRNINDIVDIRLPNLIYSLDEVKNIKTIIPNSDVFTGLDASEAIIKRLSDKDELKNYKIIHFAAHCIISEDIPELSAIVLSRENGKENIEDNLLTVNEIQEMNLMADCVILSACESGLGRVLSGEGIVGFTQAFMTAGANSVIVSQWPVRDTAARDFMVQFYKELIINGNDYAKTLTTVKRQFIKSKQYSHSFYWGAFNYYGR